jgi:hypothetical protein
VDFFGGTENLLNDFLKANSVIFKKVKDAKLRVKEGTSVWLPGGIIEV